MLGVENNDWLFNNQSPKATNCFSIITFLIIRENKIIDQFPTPKHQQIWLLFWKLLVFNVTVEPRYFEVPREMKKKFEIAGLRNNRGSVKGKGKSKGIRSFFEIAGTSN